MEQIIEIKGDWHELEYYFPCMNCSQEPALQGEVKINGVSFSVFLCEDCGLEIMGESTVKTGENKNGN